MGKFQKSLILIIWALCVPVFLLAQKKGKSIVEVTASIQYISDIDFVKLEYKMELRLLLRSKDSLAIKNIQDQIAIKGAKEMKVEMVPHWSSNVITSSSYSSSDSTFEKQLKINCIMIENWDLNGYPFDRQTLTIILYNISRDIGYFKLVPIGNKIYYCTKEEQSIKEDQSIVAIENGWVFTRDSAIVSKTDTVVHDPFNRTQVRNDTVKTDRMYSAIYYSIPVRREHQWQLFFKLLIGMYVAFFVAFISLFVDIKEAQSRFDLPVGGLFAAIANKYIIESILPQSPKFSLVDWLHSVTIISILVIIAYSARLLFKVKAVTDLKTAKPFKNDNRNIRIILTIYILINVVSIVWACSFNHK